LLKRADLKSGGEIRKQIIYLIGEEG